MNAACLVAASLAAGPAAGPAVASEMMQIFKTPTNVSSSMAEALVYLFAITVEGGLRK
jgi:hypothetical protein